MTDSAYPILSPEAVALVREQLFELLRTRFGDLSPEQEEEVRERIAAQVTASESLHAFPLTNADEPAFVLDLGCGERA